MTERRGPLHWRAGPRLTRTVPLDPAADSVADPANGEKVPRCRICGMPETRGNKLLPGLWAYIRWSAPLTLCERCVRSIAPDPLIADPLTIDDAA